MVLWLVPGNTEASPLDALVDGRVVVQRLDPPCIESSAFCAPLPPLPPNHFLASSRSCWVPCPSTGGAPGCTSPAGGHVGGLAKPGQRFAVVLVLAHALPVTVHRCDNTFSGTDCGMEGAMQVLAGETEVRKRASLLTRPVISQMAFCPAVLRKTMSDPPCRLSSSTPPRATPAPGSRLSRRSRHWRSCMFNYTEDIALSCCHLSGNKMFSVRLRIGIDWKMATDREGLRMGRWVSASIRDDCGLDADVDGWSTAMVFLKRRWLFFMLVSGVDEPALSDRIDTNEWIVRQQHLRRLR